MYKQLLFFVRYLAKSFFHFVQNFQISPLIFFPSIVKKNIFLSVSEDMEKDLWQRKILGKKSQQLLWTVYYLVGKFFCLRGGKEQHQLAWGNNPQITNIGMGKER